MRIISGGKASINKVIRIVTRQEKYLLNVAYYKLWAEENIAYYIIGLGGQGYRVGGVGEIIDQALIISRVSSGWSSMGKKPKIVAGVNLRSSQRHGSTMTNTMKSDFSDAIRDVMQANHQNDAPSIAESRRMVRS